MLPNNFFENQVRTISIPVQNIRYTQDSIGDHFKDGKSLQYTIDMLKRKEIKPEDIPVIRVGIHNEQYRSLDNRRLYCFKKSGVKMISAKVKPLWHGKCTSQNYGMSVTVRKSYAYDYDYDYDEYVYKNNGYENDEYRGNDYVGQRSFYCDICDRTMQISDRNSHLNGKKHKEAKELGLLKDRAVIAYSPGKPKKSVANQVKKSKQKTKSYYKPKIEPKNPKKVERKRRERAERDRQEQSKRQRLCNVEKIPSKTPVSNTKKKSVISEDNIRAQKAVVSVKSAKAKRTKPPIMTNITFEAKDERGKQARTHRNTNTINRVPQRSIGIVTDNINILVQNKRHKFEKRLAQKSKEITGLQSQLTLTRQEMNVYKRKLKKKEQSQRQREYERELGRQRKIVQREREEKLRQERLRIERQTINNDRVEKSKEIAGLQGQLTLMRQEMNVYKRKLAEKEQLSHIQIDIGSDSNDSDLSEEDKYEVRNKMKVCMSAVGVGCGFGLVLGVVTVLGVIKKYM